MAGRPGTAGRIIGLAVAWQSWREQLAAIGEEELLADVEHLAEHFGFSATVSGSGA